MSTQIVITNNTGKEIYLLKKFSGLKGFFFCFCLFRFIKVILKLALGSNNLCLERILALRTSNHCGTGLRFVCFITGISFWDDYFSRIYVFSLVFPLWSIVLSWGIDNPP